jgi:mRNA interferase RelE/StbE
VTCRRPAERRLRVRFVQLAENPFDLRLSTPLTERAGVRRSRVGGWRILFSAGPDAKVLHVLTVDTRGQVYKHS